MLWEKQIADEKNQKFTLRYFLHVHPVPKGENVYGVAIDKISGGQVLEREEVSGLSDRPEGNGSFFTEIVSGRRISYGIGRTGG